MKKGLVSVIIPVYMDYPYIIKTLDSIISQTHRPIEVLIVYTPGDEETLEFIENASQNYEFIRIIESKAKGPSPARNIGIQKSRGEYIVFIDADDYWDTKFLDACIKSIKEYSADTCVTDYYTIHENGKKNRITNLVKFPTILDFLNEKAWIRTGNALLSSKIIKKAGIVFREPLFYGEDTLFFLMYLLNAQKVVSVQKPMFYKTIRKGSITTNTELITHRIEQAILSAKIFESYVRLRDLENGNEIIEAFYKRKLPRDKLIPNIAMAKNRLNAIGLILRYWRYLSKFDIDFDYYSLSAVVSLIDVFLPGTQKLLSHFFDVIWRG